MNARILVVDDDRSMCEFLEEGLKRRHFEVLSFTSASGALDALTGGEFDVILTDLRMPGADGVELCARITGRRPDIPVVVMTGFGSLDTAVAALRAGAYDFVSKPVDLDALTLLLERAVRHRQLLERVRVLSQNSPPHGGFDDLLGESSAMRKVYDLVSRLADLDTSVLIVGESGTGKELVARLLHNHSSRKAGPFVAFNCTAVPATLLESELFGHVRGAFTDARADRDGLFVQAHEGTLFLDEIADMPLSLQPKLLRALEERQVRPVGGTQERSFDARILAATHRDLESMVAEGAFREDLFYRLNVIQLHLPPLRARDNDVLLLADHFRQRFTAATGKPVIGISAPAAAKLVAYPWPGNVRELRNCIERAVALAQHDKLTVDDLPEKIAGHIGSNLFVTSGDSSDLITLDELERRYVAHILRVVGGNKTMAARVLGLDRKTLYRKLERHGISEPGSSPHE